MAAEPRTDARRNGEHPDDVPPSRWAHVPLAELFAAYGNTLTDKGATVRTGHAPACGDGSGTRVVIWPGQGRFHCGKCRVSGDALTFVKEAEGLDDTRARAWLVERYGPPPRALPEIVAKGRQLRDVTRDALAALGAANDPPRIFVHERTLVRLAPSAEPADPLGIEPLADPQVRNELTGVADFVVSRPDRRTGDEVRTAVPPPREAVEDVLAQARWDFPVLRGVVDRPTLRRDGSILRTPGYDPVSGLYLDAASGLRVPTIADRPTAREVAEAVALLEQPLADFAFVSPADKATALALGLLPFVRELIPGPTPLHMIEAPTPGSGKGLLADVQLYPASGKQRGMLSQAGADDEWRKRLLSELRQGRSVVQLDNINRTLDSGALCTVLTAYPSWDERLLGANTMVRVPVRCTWLATANNPALSMEMARRTVRCRLDPQVERPWEREDFGIPRLLEWVAARRGELIWAYLTLARGWLSHGRPPWRGRALGSFEHWSDVVGGILQHAGVGGFLDNLGELYETADVETSVWRSFVLSWWEAHRDREVGTAELFPLALDTEDLDLGNGQERAQKTRFGKLLAKQRDRVIADCRIAQVGVSHKATRWRLLPTSGPPKRRSAPTDGGDRGTSGNVGEHFDTAPARGGGRAGARTPENDAQTFPYVPLRSPAEASEGLGDMTEDDAERHTQAHPGTPAEAPAAYTFVDDEAGLSGALPVLLAATEVGLDCETAVADGARFDARKRTRTTNTALDPRRGRLRLVQLATAERTYVIDCFKVDPRPLAPLLAAPDGPLLVLQNAGFDLQFLAEAGLPIPDGHRIFDTLTAARLLEATTVTEAHRRPRGHFGLAGLAARYLGEPLDKAEQSSDWSAALTGEQLAYAALDAAILLRLRPVLAERLREADLERVFALERRFQRACLWMERNGAPFDADAWYALADEAQQRRDAIGRKLAEETGATDPKTDGPLLVWSVRHQADALEAGGHATYKLDDRGRRQTALDGAVLQQIADGGEPLAGLMVEYREWDGRVTKYGRGYVKTYVNPGTGRIHPDWKPLGSEAGRMSCSEPNLQNVPQDAAYRACFRPTEGRVLIRADYAQIEVRVTAELSGDERLLAAFEAGEDIHTVTAATILGKPAGDVTPEDRQAAKCLNFGLIFGAGAENLRESARRVYKVELTEARSVELRRAFFRHYAGLRAWQARHRGEREPIDTRTVAGRRRLGIATYTQQLNSPIQGTAADGFKAAAALLWETRARVPSASLILVVHDEILLEVDRADAAAASSWLAECMERGMKAFVRRVPIIVEPEAMLDWSGTSLDTPEGGA